LHVSNALVELGVDKQHALNGLRVFRCALHERRQPVGKHSCGVMKSRYPIDGALKEVQVREGSLDVLVNLKEELLVLEIGVPGTCLLRVQWLMKTSDQYQ